MENNVLTFCYTVFNGCELLSGSIKQIYDHVDNIVICHQGISNRGNKMSVHDKLFIVFASKLAKVHLIEYHADLSLTTKENERRKHQAMIDKARELESTHFILGAADHYYKPEEFKKAVQFAISNDFDLTASRMFTYYKEPTLQIYPLEDYYMPFIMKMKPETKITSKQYDFIVDPSVRIEPVNNQYLFNEEELMMHHYSMIRVDIQSKFKNSASSVNWPEKVDQFISEYNSAKIGDSISYFKGRVLKEVPNYFNIK